MTDVEQTAQKIAEQGRDALIGRLRPAFEKAASAHSDLLQLGPDQIEAMIQRAADRADGLQWRRALASVASGELGIGLGEALSHPAVIRAQELVGAPSYEESLAKLTAAAPAAPAAEPVTPAAEEPAEAEPAPAEVEELEPAEAEMETEAEIEEPAPAVPEIEEAEAAAEEAEAAPGPVPHPSEIAEEMGEVQASAWQDEKGQEEWEEDEQSATALQEEPEDGYEDAFGPGEDGELRVSVIHLGGIANLDAAEQGVELKMSEAGLDIMRGEGEVLGRLEWDQVRSLEVPEARSRRLRRPAPTHLVIRTARGDASFEVPDVSAEELRRHLTPIVERHIAAED